MCETHVPGAPKTILIVEDSEAARRILRQILEAGGFQVIEAEDGKTGIAIASSRQIDGMLVDLSMPVMGGLEMIEALREMPAYELTPIIVLTGTSEAGAQKIGQDAGATALMHKPPNSKKLVQLFSKLLGPQLRP